MIHNAIALFFENTSIIAFGLALILGAIGYIKRTNNKIGHAWEPFEF